ncbi:MAG: C1q-like domain-containing protein [Fusobacteriaceae bacterium]
MGYLNYDPIQSVVEVNKGVSVGTIVEFPYNTIGSGYLYCDGSQFDETIHVELYKFLGTNRTPIVNHEYRIGDVKWFPKRAHIDPDFVPADGQLLNRSDYPDVTPLFEGDLVHQVNDDLFSNHPENRGHWMSGLPDVFRVPDMNGKTQNTKGSVFIRGDGLNSAQSGIIQGDAIRNITGRFRTAYAEIYNIIEAHDGAFTAVDRDVTRIMDGGRLSNDYGQNTNTRKENTLFDASRVVPTANENRSLNLAGCWGVRVKQSTVFAIKAYGSVDNEGNFDLDALAQENVKLKADIAKLKDKPIISLNGNTNESVSSPNGVLIPQYAMVFNEGFAYNASAGTVTVPKAGVYRIQFSYTTRDGAPTSTSNSTAAIFVNGAKHTVAANYYQPSTTATTITTASCELMFRLNKGDVIRFEVQAVNGTQTIMWSPGQFNCEYIKE